MLASILHQFFQEHKEVMVDVDYLLVWADNASTYHQSDLMGGSSRWRDRLSAAPPSPFSRCFDDEDGQGVSTK